MPNHLMAVSSNTHAICRARRCMVRMCRVWQKSGRQAACIPARIALHIGTALHRLTLTLVDVLTGLPLHGKDAQRMADLSEKLAEEQQQFIRAQWLDAEDAERFRHMDPRVEAQLQACV